VVEANIEICDADREENQLSEAVLLARISVIEMGSCSGENNHD
jgi:hypothetical protein